jgi:ApaG protein
MQTAITRGVKVSVETFYQPDYSSPGVQEYAFAYRITISNESAQTVQLLRRHWFIVDANGETREVEGEGVVGVQPILLPGTSHQYISGCSLRTEIGKMYGTYLMQRVNDGKMFYVVIPTFLLCATLKLN